MRAWFARHSAVVRVAYLAEYVCVGLLARGLPRGVCGGNVTDVTDVTALRKLIIIIIIYILYIIYYILYNRIP